MPKVSQTAQSVKSSLKPPRKSPSRSTSNPPLESITVTESKPEETPLYGSISVTENPFAENHCMFCGRVLPIRAPGAKGRPVIYHPDCGQLSRSLDHVANSLDKIQLTQMAARRLRARLFWISNHLPIMRKSNGQFSASTPPVPEERGAGGSGPKVR